MANEDLSRALVDKDPVPQFISMFCTCWSAWQSSERTAGDVLIFSPRTYSEIQEIAQSGGFPGSQRRKARPARDARFRAVVTSAMHGVWLDCRDSAIRMAEAENWS